MYIHYAGSVIKFFFFLYADIRKQQHLGVVYTNCTLHNVQPLPYDFRGKHIKNFAKFVSEIKEATHTVMYAVYEFDFFQKSGN
jgi:hypothetical protein